MKDKGHRHLLRLVWYTTHAERDSEVAVAASRLRSGEEEWEEASPFWDAPNRNDHCPVIGFDGKKTLDHLNSLSMAATWGIGASYAGRPSSMNAILKEEAKWGKGR